MGQRFDYPVGHGRRGVRESLRQRPQNGVYHRPTLMPRSRRGT